MIRSIWDRAKASLYFIPGLFIGAAAGLAWAANRLDATGGDDSLPLLLPTSLDGARTLLASIAGATITVAALVFSITALTVQLASSQYSPRVLDGFLRDRAQQVVIGVVVGTFTFSLLSLAMMGAGVREQEGVFAAWAATIASALGLATVVAIVYFVDHVTRRLRISNVVRRIAADTTATMERLFGGRPSDELTSWDADELGDPRLVIADRTGWVQRVQPDEILDSLPPGAILELTQPVGSFVIKGGILARAWLPEGTEEVTELLPGVTIGDSRTTVQDPAFGIRQLTDIALRALSPGINDPATASDALRHLAEPVLVALLGNAPPRSLVGAQGARLFIPDQLSPADYLTRPFMEIRNVAAGQPLVLRAMEETLHAIREQLDRAHRSAGLALVDAELEAVQNLEQES